MEENEVYFAIYLHTKGFLPDPENCKCNGKIFNMTIIPKYQKQYFAVWIINVEIASQ